MRCENVTDLNYTHRKVHANSWGHGLLAGGAGESLLKKVVAKWDCDTRERELGDALFQMKGEPEVRLVVD